MRLIHQSLEILEQKDFSLSGIKKFIERCGRVCYKSEDRITDDSYETFVDNLIKRGHDRPLEFGTVHLRVPARHFASLREKIGREWSNLWLKYDDADGYVVYASTNYRYYLKLCELTNGGVAKWFTDDADKRFPQRYTVRFITDRGTMDEFRTHIGLSHLAESTRYCNYSQKRFGGDITFIVPNWMEEHSNTNKTLINALCNAGKSYFSLLHEGWKPQQARCVLPLGIKSELISCGFLEQWENFFYRRDDEAAHPMARELAQKVRDEFVKRDYLKLK